MLVVIDSYGIELVRPCREGRSDSQLGTKELSNLITHMNTLVASTQKYLTRAVGQEG